MASHKSVTDVLATLTGEELSRMRSTNERDLDRARETVLKLEIERQQILDATAKRARGKPGRPGALNPTVVLDALNRTEQPATPAAVTATLVASGLDVNVNAVRNHLNQLAKDGDLEKDEAKKFSLNKQVFVPADFTPANITTADFPTAADDDIPF